MSQSQSQLKSNYPYKIFQLKNQTDIERIIVFYGDTGNEDLDLNEVIKRDKNAMIIQEVFSESEKRMIAATNVSIYFSRQQIHLDDTISDIKLKIIDAVNEAMGSVMSYDEIYLFCEEKKRINIFRIFQTLSNHKRRLVTRSRLDNFLSNIILNESREKIGFNIEDKTEYDYDDIISLNIEDQVFYMDHTLGQINREFYRVNPFSVGESAFFKGEQDDIDVMTTTNNELLMNNGDILDNRIYLCLASDVLGDNRKDNVKIYFPYLFEKGILNIEQLDSQRTELVQQSIRMVDENRVNYNKVDTLYDIYRDTKVRSNNVSIGTGIQMIRITMKPSYNIKIPLDIVFKLIHASETNPFIKYNPDKASENIFRLYANKVSTDGRKIPYVPMKTNSKAGFDTLANINTLNRDFGIITKAYKSVVSAYIYTEETEISICEFYENGDIQIYCKFLDIKVLTDVEDFIRSRVNPLIEYLKVNMEQNGYNILLFDKFRDENIIVNNIHYQSMYNMTREIYDSKKLDFSGIIDCINAVFIAEKISGVEVPLRFKRVADFDEDMYIESSILDFINAGEYSLSQEYTQREFLQLLTTNYNISNADAKRLIARTSKEFQMKQDAATMGNIKMRKLKFTIPGFKVVFRCDNINFKIVVSVEEINNIAYLDILPIYIDSVIRLLQDRSSISIPIECYNVSDTIAHISVAAAAAAQITDITDLIHKTRQIADINGKPAVVIEEVEEPELDEEEDLNDMGMIGYSSDDFTSNSSGGQVNSSSSNSGPIVASSSSENSSPIATAVSSPEEEEEEPSVQDQSTASSKPIVPIKPIIQDQRTILGIPIFPSEPEEEEEEVSASDQDKSTAQSSSSIPIVQSSPSIPSEPIVQSSSSEPEEEASASDQDKSTAQSIPIVQSSSSEPIVQSSSSISSISSEPIVQSSPSISSISSVPEEEASFVSSISSEPKKKSNFETEFKKIQSQFQKEPEDDGYFPKSKASSYSNIGKKSISTELSNPEVDYNEMPELEPSYVLPATKSKSKSEEESNFEKVGQMGSPAEEEPEEEPEEEQKYPAVKESTDVGSPADDEWLENWDGRSLTYPNPFQSRIEKKELVFFEKNVSNLYKTYSRSCQSVQRRQPVLVTDSEMRRIIKDIPDFLEKGLRDQTIIRFGTNPKSMNYYICPRYWCLKTWSPVTDKNAKICGWPNIIPPNAKTVKPGEYVYHFYYKDVHGTDDADYKQHYPGFINNKDGLCMPCCFSKIEKKQKELKSKCMSNLPDPILEEMKAKAAFKEGEKDISGQKESSVEVAPPVEVTPPVEGQKKTMKAIPAEKEKKHEDIKKPTNFPLSKGMYGHLPIDITMFLHHQNETGCNIEYTDNINKIIKNKECLLRIGVEANPLQSFLSCISVLYQFIYAEPEQKSVAASKTIKEFKNDILIPFVTLDRFITSQNGDLIQIFKSDKSEKSEKTDIAPYTESILYKKLFKDGDVETTDPKHQYFRNVVQSYENFIRYLNDDTVIIDYTYLWDMICSQDGLFIQKKGINLVILYSTCNDETCNVEIICPTNHYSSNVYSSLKPSLFLYAATDHGHQYFEPIFMIKNEDAKRIGILSLFHIRNPTLSPNIKRILSKVIGPIMKHQCNPIHKSRVYKYEDPMKLDEMIKVLKRHNYDIIYQVVNYASKVILLFVHKEENGKDVQGLVPCFPSSIRNEYDYVFIGEPSIYQKYKKTRNFLINLNKNTKINCKPRFKVLEDEKIIGILTETNQFVKISEPTKFIEDIKNDDDLIPLREDNLLDYYNNEDRILNDGEEDKERTEEILLIRLETLFYNAFRNTIRLLLNKYDYVKLREQLEDIIQNMFLTYNQKYKMVLDILKHLVRISNKIIFVDIEVKDYIGVVKDFSTCLFLDKTECDIRQPLCSFTTDCQLNLPNKGILSEELKYDNETIYFGKLTDQLIRYKRINSYIFKPNTYLSFGSLNYNLNNDEILIMETEVKDYFENLIEDKINPYVHYNTYDNANLIEKRANLSDFEKEDNSECVTEIEKVKMIYWKACFISTDFAALKYYNTSACGYKIIIDIVNRIREKELTIENIKSDLYKLYSNLFLRYKQQIINILETEGKKYLTDQLNMKSINIMDVIYSEEYFITNFDLMILMIYYKIPAILISNKPIFLSLYERRFLILNDTIAEPSISNSQTAATAVTAVKSNTFVFIITSPSRNEHIATYQLINKIEDNRILLSLDELQCNKKKDIELALTEYTDINTFLGEYQVRKKTKYQERGKISKLNEILSLQAEREGHPIVPIEVVKKKTTGKKKTKRFLPLTPPEVDQDETIDQEKRIIEEIILTYKPVKWNQLRKQPNSELPPQYNPYRGLTILELKQKIGKKQKAKTKKQRPILLPSSS